MATAETDTPEDAAGLFDTHCHFECAEEEIGGMLERAGAAGVAALTAVGGSDALNRGVWAASRVAADARSQGRHVPDVLRAVGWERDQAATPFGDLPPLDLGGVCAVGEIGLDYYYEGAARAAQRDLFSRQLELAAAHSLPVIIHTREADDDTLGILREIPSRGVIHCFTGSVAFCRALLDLGFFVSISGIVTFRAADNVREAALAIPEDRLLIETDAPFLAPVPLRGRPNEPAFIVHTARFLAELRGVSLSTLAAATAANARRVFASPEPA